MSEAAGVAIGDVARQLRAGVCPHCEGELGEQSFRQHMERCPASNDGQAFATRPLPKPTSELAVDLDDLPVLEESDPQPMT